MAFKLHLHKPGDDDERPPEPGADAPARPTLPDFVMTPTARRIFNTLETVHALGELGGIRGNSGLGKTTAVREYARQYPGVHRFTVSDMARSKRDLLAMFCERFCIYEHLSFKILRGLERHLQYEMQTQSLEDRRVLVIVDEAQHLTRDAASLVRSLSDETGAGFVFAGNHDTLKERHKSGRSALSQPAAWSGEMAQVMSRMSAWCELERLDVEDAWAFLEACGVSRDRRDLVACLAQWFTKPGGLRIVRNIIREALRMEDGWPFTVEGFDAAADFLGFHSPGRFG